MEGKIIINTHMRKAVCMRKIIALEGQLRNVRKDYRREYEKDSLSYSCGKLSNLIGRLESRLQWWEEKENELYK